jgi:hypothetical protein
MTLTAQPEHILVASIIRQACDDALENIRLKHILRNNYENMKKDQIQRFEWKRNELKDARNFIMTKRLDNFISTNCLALEPKYIRRKYLEFEKMLYERLAKGDTRVFIITYEDRYDER